MARSSPPHSARARASTSAGTTPPRSSGSGHRLRTHSSAPAPTSAQGDCLALDAEAQRVLAQLETVALELEVAVRHEDDVRFVLTVRHARARALWRHRRSFDEYHALQERLLRALHHGHFCGGECPWLETFLVSYFPTAVRFQLGFLLERRRAALLHVLQTVRSFLLERRNLTCAVAKTHVAREFLSFVYGDLLDERGGGDGGGEAPVDGGPLTLKISELHARSSITASSGGSEEDAAAGLRRSFAEAGLSPVSRSSASAVENGGTCALCDLPMPAKNIYVMQLRCGHRFHDECVLPKLNEALRCPTCGACDA